MEQAPNPEDPLVMKFLRQNIQINMGCNFNYNVKKSRRKPSGIQEPLSQPRVELRKNLFFPLLLEEWSTLAEEKKQFWRNRLIEEGIMPPESETHEKKNSDSMEQCMSIDSRRGFWSKFVKVMITPL